MPIYEYQARNCRGPSDCPKRFAFWQSMNDSPITQCVMCQGPLERIPSLFSAGGGLVARSAAMVDPPAQSQAPPATVHNIFGGGLKIQGCGHGPLPGRENASGKESS
ncbi:MAG TPA: zinc ribbon domain-containing protein [Nitrospira sp.]|nr:zinc ribbon domain-containing protein [Nitrospira sp.]HNI68026.1 zinc ribbon domain-containing protein [Nitrospira sp.]